MLYEVITEEIKERSLLFEGLKHYFIIRFPQRTGALRDFVITSYSIHYTKLYDVICEIEHSESEI